MNLLLNTPACTMDFEIRYHPRARSREFPITTAVLDRHIEASPEVAGGKPRIVGRRITVQNVAIWHDRLGMTADQIAMEYDLTLGEVHAALAWYFDHREERRRGRVRNLCLIAHAVNGKPIRIASS